MRKQLTTFSISLLLLVSGLVVLSGPEHASGQTPPPASGDWVVADTTLMNDTTILLDGNLTVTDTGTLTLQNVTLVLNCSANRTLGIEVEGSLFGSKGTFNVYNCTIMSVNDTQYYNFTVNGRMTMKDSKVLHAGGSIDLADPLNSLGGIQVGSSDVLIQNTLITDYEAFGISVLPLGAPTISKCNISMELNLTGLGFTVGILDTAMGFTSPSYIDNHISGNLISGILSIGFPVGSTFATIKGNTFESNTAGVTCIGTDPDILDNTFTGNLVSSIALMDSDSEVSGNKITLSGSAVNVLNPCNPDIHNNTINTSLIGVMLMNGTACRVHHNNISANLLYGISAAGALSEIDNNELGYNLVAGLNLDDSKDRVHENSIDILPLGTGIRVLNDSAANIYQNSLTGAGGSTGIVLEGNVSMTPIIRKNTFTMGTDAVCMDIYGFAPVIKDNVLDYALNSHGITAAGSGPDITGNTFNGPSAASGAVVTDSTVSFTSNDVMGSAVGFSGYNCSADLDTNSFSHIQGFGIYLEECTGITLAGNTFDDVNANPAGAHDRREIEITNSSNVQANLQASYCRLLNSTYNTTVGVASGGRLDVDWFLDVTVLMPDDSPADNVTVDLVNTSGQKTDALVTGPDGKTIWNQITQKVIRSTGTEHHSPYDVQAALPPWEDNETIVLDRSKSVTLKLGFNSGPSAPFNLTPQTTHDTTPLLTWNRSTDPDGDPVHYTISIGTTLNGADIVDGFNTTNNSFQVGPPLKFQKYYVTLQAHTPDGNASAKFLAGLDITNAPPVLAPVGDRVLYLEDKPTLHFHLNATDPDTDPVDILKYSADTKLFKVNATSGEINWTPSAKDEGVHAVNFSASDGFAADYEIVTITVTTRNKAPVADAGEDFNATVGEKITLNGSGSYDPDGGSLKYDWTPDKLVYLNITDGARPWYKADKEGNYTFTLKVQDDKGVWSDPDTVTISVRPKKVEKPEPVSGLVLKFGKVTPASGTLNDTYVFTVTLIGINVTQKLIDTVRNETKVQLRIDEFMTLDMNRPNGPIDLVSGVPYSVMVKGAALGLGNHTFRFVCDHKSVTGDVGVFSGPVVSDSAADDDTVDDDADDDDVNPAESMGVCLFVLLLLILLVMVAAIISVVYIKRRMAQEDERMEDKDGEDDEEEDADRDNDDDDDDDDFFDDLKDDWDDDDRDDDLFDDDENDDDLFDDDENDDDDLLDDDENDDDDLFDDNEDDDDDDLFDDDEDDDDDVDWLDE